MAALLEEDAEMRERFGKEGVGNCTEARRFMALYEEDKDRIDAELLAKHPEASIEDTDPPSEDEPPTTEPPTEEVAKIHNGYETSFPFVVKLKTIVGLCSGVLISPRALLTSAHCVPVNGTYLTTIEQQQVAGASPVVMMSAATWLTLKKHPYYLGAGHGAADLAIGTLYYSNSSFGTNSFARIWMDSIPIGGTDFMLGFGSTYPGENTWNGRLNAGTGRIDGVYDYEVWTFGDTSPPRTGRKHHPTCG